MILVIIWAAIGFFNLVAWIVFLAVLFVASIRIVSPNTVKTVEFFGRFHRILRAGFNLIVPFVETTKSQVLYRRNFPVEVEWVTSDNVTAYIGLNVIYYVDDNGDNSKEWSIFKSVYSIDDPRNMMKSTIDEQLRWMIVLFTHKEIFSKREELGKDIEEKLRIKLSTFGFTLDSIQVRDVKLEAKVMSAMNKIVETQKFKEAAYNEAEAQKIMKVKEAEAEKESKILLWEGMAGQRMKIAEWFKESVDLIKQKLSTWVNYIYTCISSYITSSNYSKEINYDNQIPFKYAFCSASMKLYFYKNKIFLDKDKYLQYKQSVNNKINFYEKYKLNLIKKMLVSQKMPSFMDHIENDVKDYVNNNYSFWTNRLQKALLLSNLEKYLINKYSIYNGRIIIPNILTKDMIDFISTYYFDKCTELIDQAYQQKIGHTTQYKQEVISNYGKLKQEYNQLQKEYKQYKIKTTENRQKAIKLTVVLTKILWRYHNKQIKLKLLDKIDQIIETKYWPDKFKNQDLIWYVKDYLKIIRLAIQLSE